MYSGVNNCAIGIARAGQENALQSYQMRHQHTMSRCPLKPARRGNRLLDNPLVTGDLRRSMIIARQRISINPGAQCSIIARKCDITIPCLMHS